MYKRWRKRENFLFHFSNEENFNSFDESASIVRERKKEE